MRITRETDYGMRSVLYLASKNEAIVMIDEIAEAMRIPRSHLAKILQKLARRKIVSSFRGVKGGFRLAREPQNISFLDVIEAIQGPIAMNVCTIDNKACELSRTCTVHPVWVELRGEVEKFLRDKTFSA